MRYHFCAQPNCFRESPLAVLVNFTLRDIAVASAIASIQVSLGYEGTSYLSGKRPSNDQTSATDLRLSAADELDGRQQAFK